MEKEEKINIIVTDRIVNILAIFKKGVEDKKIEITYRLRPEDKIEQYILEDRRILKAPFSIFKMLKNKEEIFELLELVII